MKFTKKIVAVVAGVAMCAGLAACGGSRSGQATGGDAKIEKGATIGISMPTKSEERWNKDGNNLKAKLEKAGYKVILSFADDKPAQQNADRSRTWSTTTPRSSSSLPRTAPQWAPPLRRPAMQVPRSSPTID